MIKSDSAVKKLYHCKIESQQRDPIRDLTTLMMAFVLSGGACVQRGNRSFAGGRVCTGNSTAAASVSIVQPGKRCRIVATSSSVNVNAATTTTLQEFLADAEKLGTIRFINISDGGVLETIGRFDYSKKVIEVPNRGAFLTLANDDKTFECHINVSKVAKITMSKDKAKIGGHDLYVIRLKNENDGLILSCLLMWDPSQGPGIYLHGAVSEFERLQAKYGDSLDLKQ